MASAVNAENERIFSSWQQPINQWSEKPNSIHNDAVATKIGMRGGTIPGTVHLDHFVPLIQEAWGLDWFRSGAISMYYTYATTHKEEVRAVMDRPSGKKGEKLDAYVETPVETIVAKGSVSIGNPSEPNYVASLQLANARRNELRILADLETGVQCPAVKDLVPTDGGGSGEYEDCVVYPASMYGILNAGFPVRTVKPAVGFFGATEIRVINGPIRLNTEYCRKGTVVCVGASPRTEFAWVDSQLIEKATGLVIAEMRHMTRWMKASSELWK